MPDDLVTLTINGHEVTVRKGILLVEAARQASVEIPVFCYHPKLKPVGACRMCLVEVEKMPALQTACTTPVSDGMVVRSDSAGAVAAQNGVLELMLANHPLDCPICDKGGECPLQDNTFRYGLGASRMVEEKRHLDKAFPLSERIVLDKERCIMCLRCVRFQREIPGDEALAIVDRGGSSEIGTLPGESFDSPFSGNTIEICPVGALTSRQYRFRARPWDLRRIPSVCAGCAVGCNIELHARDGQILRMVARDNPQVDGGWLCDHGRFETLPPLSGNRPLQPLARRNGSLEPVGWDVALTRAAELLRAGPAGVLASPSLTNEAIWLLAGPLRSALVGHGGTVGFATAPADAWPVQGALANLPDCKKLLIAGLDAWTELPVLALWLRRATERGGALVVVGPKNGLARDTAVWLQVGEPEILPTLIGLLGALDGGEAEPAVKRAAEHLTVDGPAALLTGSSVAADPVAREPLVALVARLGATAADGLLGSPALAANGRGVQELAPDLAANWSFTSPDTLLLVGAGPWTAPSARRLILATNGPFEERDEIELVLPLAHLYEQPGSLTNLEGRVQRLEPGGFGAPTALPDWSALARLTVALGEPVPTDLAGIRIALCAQFPAYAAALTRDLPAHGHVLQQSGVAPNTQHPTPNTQNA